MTWNTEFYYMFPPFSLLVRVNTKTHHDNVKWIFPKWKLSFGIHKSWKWHNHHLKTWSNHASQKNLIDYIKTTSTGPTNHTTADQTIEAHLTHFRAYRKGRLAWNGLSKSLVTKTLPTRSVGRCVVLSMKNHTRTSKTQNILTFSYFYFSEGSSYSILLSAKKLLHMFFI